MGNAAATLGMTAVLGQVVISGWERRCSALSSAEAPPRPALMHSNLQSPEEVLQVCRWLGMPTLNTREVQTCTGSHVNIPRFVAVATQCQQSSALRIACPTVEHEIGTHPR